MGAKRWTILLGVLLTLARPATALGQDAARWYGGGVVGVSALSADAEHRVGAESGVVSLYKPETGLAANVLVGVHLTDYVTVQANYIWNRNALTLLSTSFGPEETAFYEQSRDSSQHAVVADVLLYFRNRESRFRPYLSVGGGVVRLVSSASGVAVIAGVRPPEQEFAESRHVLRVAVGIDVKTGPGWSVRYSFSESLSRNPISQALTPPARRRLTNFQTLLGVVRMF